MSLPIAQLAEHFHKIQNSVREETRKELLSQTTNLQLKEFWKYDAEMIGNSWNHLKAAIVREEKELRTDVTIQKRDACELAYGPYALLNKHCIDAGGATQYQITTATDIVKTNRLGIVKAALLDIQGSALSRLFDEALKNIRAPTVDPREDTVLARNF